MEQGHRFIVYGTVRGQGRPRFSKWGTYKSQADKAWEERIKAAYINSNGAYFGDHAIGVRIDVFRSLPKSTPKRIQFEHDTHKPDIDNIAKSVLDALNGIAWNDDAQILLLEVTKHDRERLPCEELHVEIKKI